MDGHEWHLFDAEKAYEAARFDGMWHIRTIEGENVQTLTDEEFEQLRAEGPNPKGL